MDNGQLNHSGSLRNCGVRPKGLLFNLLGQNSMLTRRDHIKPQITIIIHCPSFMDKFQLHHLPRHTINCPRQRAIEPIYQPLLGKGGLTLYHPLIALHADQLGWPNPTVKCSLGQLHS
jgi:hypothetical protein